MSAPKPTAEWLEEFQASLKKHVNRGDYREGLELAKKAMKLFPENVVVRFQYAKLLGDWADELPPKAQAKAKREAIAIIKPITRALSGAEPEFRFRVCLNYYYQKADYAGMHRFGKRLAGRGERNGEYAQGVAGAYRALEEHKRENPSGQRYWSRSARDAWLRYGLKSEKYYFPHYCMALARALRGEKKEALRSLKDSARLSGRPLSDWEFKDVLEIIRGSASGG